MQPNTVAGTAWPDGRPEEYTYEGILALRSNSDSPAASAAARAAAYGEIPARKLELAVMDWYPESEHPEIVKTWRAHEAEHPKDAKEFSKFLDKLQHTVSAKIKTFKPSVTAWLSRISRSPKEAFAAARYSSGSCEDRVSLAFNKMQALLIYDDIRNGLYDKDIGALVGTLRNEFRLMCLEEFAGKKLKTMQPKPGLDEVDAIEVYLELQMALRHKLDLTVASLAMRYKSDLTSQDLADATNIVKEREDAEFPADFANSPYWDAFLQRLYSEKYAEFEDQRSDAIDKALETIEEDVDAEIAARGLMDDDETRSGLRKGIVDKICADLKMPFIQEILNLNNCSNALAPVW